MTEKEVRKQIKKEHRRETLYTFRYEALPALLCFIFCVSLSVGITLPIIIHTSNFGDNPPIVLNQAGVIITGILSAISCLLILAGIVFIIIIAVYSTILTVRRHKKEFEEEVERRMNK